jgi:hypothetical protein
LKQFDIELHSFDEVQEFVEVATVQPFRVVVGNDRTLVNAKSFMGMFTLDHHRPLRVTVRCSEEEFGRFREQTKKIFM